MKKFLLLFFILPTLAFGGAVSAGPGNGGSGTGSAVTQTITASNTFSVGQGVVNTGSGWVLAKANSYPSTTNYLAGVVSAATSGSFTVVTGGLISTLSGLTANTQYYLSDSTAGAFTSTAPTNTASCVVTGYFATSSTTAQVNIGNPTSLQLIPFSSLATLTAQSVLANATGSAASGTSVALNTLGDTILGTSTAGLLVQTGVNNFTSLANQNYGTLITNGSGTSAWLLPVSGGDGVMVSANSTGAPQWLANSGTAGYVLTANSGAPPSWQAATGGTLANPTATIGLTAVNGSATSGIRSDGAPALSQAIVPTWTGLHTFSVAPTSSSGTNYGLEIVPNYTDTSTAGETDLYINRTGTYSGSGAHYGINVAAGGTSYFGVSTSGYMQLTNGSNSVSITPNTGVILGNPGITLNTSGSNSLYEQVGGSTKVQISSTGTSVTGTLAVSGATTLSGQLIVQSTSGLGYATGQSIGGAVTQATSRTTGVTLNFPTGAITLFSAAGSTTASSFTVTDSAVAATDTIIVNQKSGSNLYEIFVTNVAAGSFQITEFTTGGTTSEAPVFNFAVVHGSAN